MVKKIIKYPNPSLRKPTEELLFPLKPLVFDIDQHIVDLNDTLKAEDDGLAIASNQILENGYRMFVVKDDKRFNDIFPGGVVFNPKWSAFAPIEGTNQIIISREGCLSFPGMSFDIPRYDRILVEFKDIDGKSYEKEVSGLISRMVQHECDHLDGKLFIEMLPKKAQVSIRNSVIARKKAGKW